MNLPLTGIKLVNTTIWLSSTLYNWGYYLLYGNQDSAELKLARENKIKLENIEYQLAQILAVQNHDIDNNNEPNFTRSFVIIDSNETEQNVNEHKQKEEQEQGQEQCDLP